ncbi:MAG TPA: ABC transporter permease [Microthrixaceae bacterium]|nr:ABC transporter permease [Microthrixaceae bacterium]
MGGGPGVDQRLRRGVAYVPAFAPFALQIVVWPTSLGTVLSGLILGVLGALLAAGMSLVWRSNQIVTFAQSDLGALPTTAALLTMSKWGWPIWLAGPVGLIVALAIGGSVQALVIRRFDRAPRLIATVATIGIGQLAAFGALMLPKWWGDIATIRTFDPPFELRVSIGQVIFDANDLLGVVAALAALAGLGMWLRMSDVGVAIRAAATNPDRASMLGIPVRTLHAQVWAVAAGLSFVGVFFTSGVSALAPGPAFSFGLLVRALAAMVIGRFTNLGRVVVASVALGALDAAISRSSSGPAAVAPVMLAVIVVALLVQRAQRGRVGGHTAGEWRLDAEVAPIPRVLAVLPEVRAARAALSVLAIGIAVVVPHVVGTAGAIKAGVIVIFAIIGLSTVVLTGWSGQVSLGQMAFVGAGGAFAAWAIVRHGVDPLVAYVGAGAVGALVAVVVGLPALRLRGLSLAVVTLSLGLAASTAVFSNSSLRFIPRETFRRPPLLGRIDIDSPVRLYYVALAALALTILAVTGARRSRFGRALVAQRDNERAAQAYGVNLTRARLAGFALSGWIAASAGSLLVVQTAAFRGDTYSVGAGVDVFVATVIGGIGAPPGAVLGGLYLKGAALLLPGVWQALASGAGVLLVLMTTPNGLLGALVAARDAGLRSVARRRGIEALSVHRSGDATDPDEAAA